MAMYSSNQYYFPNGCVDERINLSYEEAKELIPMYNGAESFYTTFVLPSILLFGLLDNACFIYVVAQQSSMKTATNRYLVNLAISDVIFLASSIGEKLWRFTHSPFLEDDSPITPVGCILLPLLGDTAYFASLLFITLVSAEIFNAICFPKGKSSFQNRTWSVWLIVIVWLISCITAGILVPSNFGAIYYICFEWEDPELTGTWPTTITKCGTHVDWLVDLMHIVQVVPFLVTLTLNVYLFVRIINGLNQSIDRLRSHRASNRDGDTRLRNQIATMLVVNGIVFFVLLAPFELLSFLQVTTSDLSRAEATFKTISRGLMYLNSVVNPIIYTAMSQRYREAFKSAFLPTPKCRVIAVKGTPRTPQPHPSSSYLKGTQTVTKL